MKKSLLILFLTFLFALTGCSLGKRPVAERPNQDTAVLYFANKEGNDLIPINLDITSVGFAELPSFIINALLEGPDSPDLSLSVRAGTRVLSLTNENGSVCVDFSKEFYHEQPVYDILSAAAVVKSLCSATTINLVYITVEGVPLQNPEGGELGFLKETDIVFDADALLEGESNVILYFSDSNAEHLVREIRRVKIPRGDSMDKVVLAELIKGPKSSGVARTLPQETKIRSVETKDRVCFVNLSSDFVSKNNVGTAAERLIIFSIVNSLTELSTVDKVQFLVEGEKLDVYHHMIINEPIERDISTIQK